MNPFAIWALGGLQAVSLLVLMMLHSRISAIEGVLMRPKE